jgi:hypothetical protein
MPHHNHTADQDDVLDADAHCQELLKDIEIVPASVEEPCDDKKRHVQYK